ncbi:MAG: hypothetical protein HYX53_01205 [Chloroflexi bacterium]|nr:hypothetical protein [Chloroflexota bacterium]
MNRPLLYAAAAAVLVAASLGFAACRDTTSTTATLPPGGTPTTAVKAKTPVTGVATPTPDLKGPAPRLGGNVTKVSPAHGSQVKQSSTRTSNVNVPGGVCFEANFDGLQENIQWFRLRVDDQEVTTKMTWAVDSADNPSKGRGCYPPTDGIPVGLHTAAVSVQNPSNLNEPTKQLVVWTFEVVP